MQHSSAITLITHTVGLEPLDDNNMLILKEEAFKSFANKDKRAYKLINF